MKAMAKRKPQRRSFETWGEALRWHRDAEDMIPIELMAVVPRLTLSQVEAWEKGEDYPNPYQLRCVLRALPRMHEYTELLPNSSRGERPETDFGRALRDARTRGKLTQADLAKLLTVATAAIHQWEVGFTAPAIGAYRMIRQFLPEMVNVPPPKSLAEVWAREMKQEVPVQQPQPRNVVVFEPRKREREPEAPPPPTTKPVILPPAPMPLPQDEDHLVQLGQQLGRALVARRTAAAAVKTAEAALETAMEEKQAADAEVKRLQAQLEAEGSDT